MVLTTGPSCASLTRLFVSASRALPFFNAIKMKPKPASPTTSRPPTHTFHPVLLLLIVNFLFVLFRDRSIRLNASMRMIADMYRIITHRLERELFVQFVPCRLLLPEQRIDHRHNEQRHKSGDDQPAHYRAAKRRIL